ncbi:DUF3826 domain-containing protein [Oleiharenicola lentus]|uniref:DUF3826 domain-containing protein n=1 Tax=Oleiharenicola lentus TaxID=2508720 RepID=UPI003F680497
MHRKILTLVTITFLSAPAASQLFAAETTASVPVADEKLQKKIDQKTAKLIETAKLTDAGKIAKVKAIGNEWFATLFSWHNAHDAEINTLWSQWNQARSVVPKDEFPGEIIAVKIEETYASLKPAYENYINKLSAELTPEQIDAVKEAWSRSPGMKRTYNSYLEIAPDLSDKDKEFIKARMHLAREAAMLTDADKEIVSIFKRHKVKVEQYIGSLEWTKLHKAFAQGGAAASAAKAKTSAAPAAK